MKGHRKSGVISIKHSRNNNQISPLTVRFLPVTATHYSTVSGLIQLVISLECFIEITPDFLYPFMND